MVLKETQPWLLNEKKSKGGYVPIGIGAILYGIGDVVNSDILRLLGIGSIATGTAITSSYLGKNKQLRELEADQVPDLEDRL